MIKFHDFIVPTANFTYDIVIQYRKNRNDIDTQYHIIAQH
jgi:hypothetical protein